MSGGGRVARSMPAAAVLGWLLAGPMARADVAPRTFATPQEAAQALVEVVKANDLAALLALFGSAGAELVDSSDPATGRRNREVFLAAAAEGHRLEDLDADRKELILGNEAWPFPVPLVRGASGWSFDAAAGREEVLNRRVGRNELATIRVLHAYVAAQRAYAAAGHDGKRAGLYARRFGSDPGRQNGLYWPARPGEPRSPLGILAAKASAERVSTGVERLDTMLAGGYHRGASVLVTGAPGTAKTTLAGTFAEAVHDLANAGLTLLLVAVDARLAEVLGDDDVGRELGPPGRDLGAFHLEDDGAIRVVDDARAALPGHLVERIGALRREEAIDGEALQLRGDAARVAEITTSAVASFKRYFSFSPSILSEGGILLASATTLGSRNG